MIGVCSYEVLPDGRTAEFAVFVDDAAHSRGIGTLLLEHLTVYGRRHGIPDLLGEILPSNSPMIRMARSLGQPSRSAFDLGLVELHLDTTDSGGDAIDARDLNAARHSLGSLFAPACIAVIGADRTTGGAIQTAIARGGFSGTVYGIGTAEHCYPSFAVAPVRPDLAIIAAPADEVAGQLILAARAGARVAVVASSGFAESGAHGDALQRNLVRTARQAGIRIIGPASLGVLNTDRAVRLHASVAPPAGRGGLAIASQSGAVGISLLDQASAVGLGVSTFVSLGNKADVSGNDLLSYWFDDPATAAVALYLESLGNPRRFAHIARAVSRRKPVLVIKSGRVQTSDITVDVLFEQAGVIRCNSLGDLLDTARMLIGQPLPEGNRIAVIGNAGGINRLCAEAAGSVGLALPPLPDAVRMALRSAAPDAVDTTNPVDLGAEVNASTLSATMVAIAPHVDGIVVALGADPRTDIDAVGAAAGRIAAELSLPVAVVAIGLTAIPSALGPRAIPVFRSPEDALRAWARTARYATWRREPSGVRGTVTGLDAARARGLVQAALASSGTDRPDLIGDLLTCYGIRIDPEAPATAPDPHLIVGITHDGLFGSLVTCRLGGPYADLIGDRAVRLPPLTDRDAAQMWRSLRAAPLLAGSPGSAPPDTASLEKLLLRLARLAEDLPEVAVLDLNPVVVTSAGATVTSRVSAGSWPPTRTSSAQIFRGRSSITPQPSPSPSTLPARWSIFCRAGIASSIGSWLGVASLRTDA